MKRLLLLLLTGAAHAQQSPRPYTVAVTTAAAFAQATRSTSAGLVTDKQGFTRSGDTFFFQLTTGKRKRLLSKSGRTHEEDTAELTYLGQLPALHKYVLQVQFYEGSAILLVDQQTGVIDTLHGPPSPSPANSLVAALYQGYPYDAPNGVEVFQVSSPRLRRKFTIAQMQWLPYGLAWIDEHHFILKCLPIVVEEAIEQGKLPKKSRQNSARFSYLRVTIR